MTEESVQVSGTMRLVCLVLGKPEEKEDGDKKAWISPGSGATGGANGWGVLMGARDRGPSLFLHSYLCKKVDT